MEDIGVMPHWVFDCMGVHVVLNKETLIMTWIVMAMWILFALLASRNTRLLPNPFQGTAELLVGTWDQLIEDSLGEREMGRKYFSFICTIFLMFWISNMLGLIPFLSEPTKDINTTLSLGVIGFVVAHYSGIKAKGIGTYLKGYAEPIFFMAPLNIIGEFSKVISISFRLFGNIMGGSIIILVVSYLVYSLVLPPFLYAFFGIFVGTIQAFVFTMLTLVYIVVQIK
ncbi:MAG: F0F1 ATP synthase subunit A [Thermodesulfobacteriota bacterium]|nr:F0F1 ATP synthase subunit A [Thermodesulfobacteriota bacterium]